MITLTKITGTQILVNPELIEMVERHGDTVIALTDGNKVIVRETLEEIRARVIAFHAEVERQARESKGA